MGDFMKKYTFEEFKEKYKEEYVREKIIFPHVSEFDLMCELTDGLEDFLNFEYEIFDDYIIEKEKPEGPDLFEVLESAYFNISEQHGRDERLVDEIEWLMCNIKSYKLREE